MRGAVIIATARTPISKAYRGGNYLHGVTMGGGRAPTGGRHVRRRGQCELEHSGAL